MLVAHLVEAAKKLKKGQQAKASLFCDGVFPLVYDGPIDLDALWTVRVAGSDKTFSLWCSWQHPTCIENLPRE